MSVSLPLYLTAQEVWANKNREEYYLAGETKLTAADVEGENTPSDYLSKRSELKNHFPQPAQLNCTEIKPDTHKLVNFIRD